MSVRKNTKQSESGNDLMKARGPMATAARKTERKAPGTRASTIEDWRGVGGKKTGPMSKWGNGLRDGR